MQYRKLAHRMLTTTGWSYNASSVTSDKHQCSINFIIYNRRMKSMHLTVLPGD